MLLRFVASIAPNARYKQWRKLLGVISDNAELIRTMQNDPGVRVGVKFGAIKGCFDLATTAARSAKALTVPTLLLYGRKDSQIPPEPTIQLARDVAGPKRILFYVDGYHALDHDLQRENVFRDIDAWLTDYSGRLPSVSSHPPAAEEIPV